VGSAKVSGCGGDVHRLKDSTANGGPRHCSDETGRHVHFGDELLSLIPEILQPYLTIRTIYSVRILLRCSRVNFQYSSSCSHDEDPY
jgi:hypothetical protein